MRHLLGLGLLMALVVPANAVDLEKYLPDDTQAVVSLNWQQVLNSALAERYFGRDIEKAVKSKDLQRFTQLFDLDPLKDIYRLTVAVPANVQQRQGSILITGSFDPEKIEKGVKLFANNVKVHKAGTTPVYETKGNDGNPVFLAVLDTELAVLSTDFRYIDETIAKVAGRRKTKINAELAKMVAAQNPKQSMWLVSVVSDNFKQLANKNPQGQKAAAVLGKLEVLTGQILVEKDIKVALQARLSDAAAAKQAVDALNAGKLILTFAVSANEDLKQVAPMILELVNSIKISQKAASVGVDLVISQKLIDKVMEQANKNRP
ncbi:MAG: hypothetical protein KatS3mg105_0540 [Gemmatales bacterium]|nr:MAG: hypothetical protein KatS3mg105_0540 [Gemmatales bacterium]